MVRIPPQAFVSSVSSHQISSCASFVFYVIRTLRPFYKSLSFFHRLMTQTYANSVKMYFLDIRLSEANLHLATYSISFG